MRDQEPSSIATVWNALITTAEKDEEALPEGSRPERNFSLVSNESQIRCIKP